MGQLPPSQVTPSRPFTNAGVDYAGQFLLKSWPGRCARRYKAFLVLFVCMATSAVHLELTTDYSTAGFLAAFKRFCSRRGICATLTSDCGTNLVGADAELRRMFSSASKDVGELANLLASDGTRWIFNPPATPHFGGKWEAAVKSTKFHLKRVIGDTLLTYEEFTTVLVQIEAVLNPSVQFPEPSLTDIPLGRLSRWQQVRLMVERFWQRWSTEYLQRLQDVAKWQHSSRQIKVGSFVLIRDERYPPAKWPLGRVLETHAGADGLIHVVTVRTATSIFKRPIAKLCPLPIPTKASSNV
ncbi:uncharacterized protein LOC105202952 [Solenopsis invicta]|uniref:uncharacterized protein LOC105202952 n=1 Tax=Solenopsis invicta TaxID=13686 RepID=UPI000595C984|nr:uncharacterized protein LOC105202952 [Solenopsis invicta]